MGFGPGFGKTGCLLFLAAGLFSIPKWRAHSWWLRNLSLCLFLFFLNFRFIILVIFCFLLHVIYIAVFNLACKTTAVMSKSTEASWYFPNQNLDTFQSQTGITSHLILFIPLCIAGYQLTSAECFDLRSNRVVADQYCHYYPENIKPKPKLQECNLDPCPARSVCFNFKGDWALKE